MGSDKDNAHAIGNANSHLDSLNALGVLLGFIDSGANFEELATLEGDDDFDGDGAKFREACAELGQDTEYVTDEDEARSIIDEYGLAVEWIAKRGGHDTSWSFWGFEWLLSTGGPACRVVARCDEHGHCESARIEWQDWFQPWTALDADVQDNALLVLSYMGSYGSEMARMD